MSAAGISAQAPLGGSTVTHPNNTACQLGQLTFPGVKNAAIAAGYVRCDLSKNLKTEQKLPCMYTLEDIMDKYDISNSDLELPPDFKSMYQIDTATDTALIINKGGSDIFSQKIAYGSRQDTASLDLPLYVCHPQYNKLHEPVLGETTVLRPEIVCGIPQRGISHMLLRDCVWQTYTCGSGSNHIAKIVRIIPQAETGQGSFALPEHGLITELGDDALSSGNVLSMGTMTGDALVPLPVVFSANDPSAVVSDATSPSLPGQYDICTEQSDPDNINSVNQKNPCILDSIVVPLGKTSNPDQFSDD